MIKKCLILIIFIFLIINFIGCIDEDLIYRNKYYGFEIKPPQDWIVNETPFDPNIIVEFEYISSDHHVLMVISEPLTIFAGKTFRKHIDLIIINLSILDNFTLLSKNEIKINTMDAIEIVFNYSQIFNRSYVFETSMIQEKQVFIKNNKSFYIITYIALPEHYYLYDSAVNKSINSFNIF